MANLATLNQDVKALTFRGLQETVQKEKDGISVKDLLAHYAPRFDVNLEEKKERDILYRRINRLLAAGLETDEIQKNGGKFCVMSPEEAAKYRKEQERLHKLRVEIASLASERDILVSVSDTHVAMSFDAFKKLVKKTPAKK